LVHRVSLDWLSRIRERPAFRCVWITRPARCRPTWNLCSGGFADRLRTHESGRASIPLAPASWYRRSPVRSYPPRGPSDTPSPSDARTTPPASGSRTHTYGPRRPAESHDKAEPAVALRPTARSLLLAENRRPTLTPAAAPRFPIHLIGGLGF